MKITIEEIQGAETELVLRCSDSSAPELRKLIEQLNGLDRRIPVHLSDVTTLLAPQDVLYCEFVNRIVFVYTKYEVYPCNLSLAQLEAEYPDFFRCSKSTVVNISQIAHLRSELHGRILTRLSNGEQLLISRHYASELRLRIKQK